MKEQPIMDIVIYHNNCFDGYTAAAIATLENIGIAERYSALIPGDYTKPVPLEVLNGKNVCFVDYSCSATEMLSILDVAESVTVIDHHIGVHEELAGITHPNFNYVYDINKSGAQLAWDYFVSGTEPFFVTLIGDRDLWKKKHSEADLLSIALRTEDYGIDDIRFLLEKEYSVTGRHDRNITDSLVKKGVNYKKYHDKMVHDIAEHAFEERLDDDSDTEVLKVNCPLGLMSDVGAILAKKSPSGVAWLYYELGESTKHSLRVSAESDYDAAAYAKSNGGGGHTKAAGWSDDRWVAKPMPDVILDDKEQRANFHKQFIKTPLKPLNDVLNGGIKRGELTVLVGNSASFKSGLNTYLYLGSVISNGNLYAPKDSEPAVLRVFTEMNPKKEIRDVYRKLNPDKVVDEFTYAEILSVIEVLKNNDVNTRTFYVEPNTMTVNVLSKRLAAFDDMNTPIQAIFIDDLSAFTLTNNHHKSYEALVVRLKDLAKLYNIAVVVTCPVHVGGALNRGDEDINLCNLEALSNKGITFDTGIFVNIRGKSLDTLNLIMTVIHPDPKLKNHELMFKLSKDAILVDAKF